MKIKNIKKLLIRNLIFCGGLLLISNIESNAIDGDLDLTRKSIVRNFGGDGNDYFNSVIETNDGGIVAVGYSYSTDAGFSNKGSADAIIVKYDRDGNQLWVKNFRGSGDDCFYSVVETNDGGIIAVGCSTSTSAGFTNKGGSDAIIVKYDSNGNQQWVKNFGGSGDDCFYSVIETSDKGIIVVGYSDSTNAGFNNKGYDDAIMVKYDRDGNQLWVKNFGGTNGDYFTSAIEASDGGIIAVGYSNSTNAGFTNKGDVDAIVVKYDNEGNQQWINNFGGSSSDYFHSVIETSDGCIVVVGYSNSTNAGFNNKGYDDAIMVKYDRDGNQLWVKNFGGSDDDYLNSVIETSDKGIVAVGYSYSIDAGFNNKGGSDAIIVKYNQDCKDNEHIFDEVYNLESVNISIDNSQKLEEARNLVNNIENEELRSYLNEKLDSFNIGFGELERKTASANLDLYIKSENILMMSLDTSSITFEDFSGVEDVVKTNAVNISINSSLPYQLNAYLPTEIQNTDKTNLMDKDILNIKENSETTYQTFVNTTDKIILKDNCPSGNDIVHGVDIKLVGGIAHEKDVYKTTIKFEAEQK